MSISDLFWVFLVVIAVVPFIQRRILQMMRLRALRRLEKKRHSRVIALIHRQETIALLGFPLMRYIDINDSEEVLRAIKLTDPDVPIDLVLHTPGGLALAAEQIALALCCREAPVTVLVPHYAMSGGTLIALAANEIIMSDNAVLGPVDPQVGGYPAASILTAVGQKYLNAVDDETLIMADIAEKALRQIRQTLLQLIGERMEAGPKEALVEKLASGIWTHDYPISVEEAQEMGLPVTTEMPEEVYDLMDLYPQTAQRRPSVQYVPAPYHSERERPSSNRR
jgi:ClpP class serine protease